MTMLVRLLLALLAFALPLGAQAQSFPALSGRVVDAANLLAPEQEAQLTQLSADIEKASSRQFVVATIPDLEGRDIADYGYQLGRHWKIGQEGANNGILLIVAPNERKVRIEVGYGLEPIMTDALANQIIQGTILPRFRDGDMPGGIIAGAGAIGEQMKLPLEAAEARAKELLDKGKSKGDDGNGWVGALIALFWVVVFLSIVLPMIFGRKRRGKRYRGGSAPVILWGPGWGSSWGSGSSSGSSWGGGGSSWGGGGGFSGGGGSFGGGGASGGW